MKTDSLTTDLPALIRREIAQAHGWIGFERFMALALYAPGLGYYAHGSRKFGHMPESGSDFVTAPELTPLFGQALAAQLLEALDHSGTDTLWEFGAGSGALAASVLASLGERVRCYTIVDLSGSLRARQRETLAVFGDRVRWVDALPERFEGVVLGNELIDAMPVRLLQRSAGVWHERGVGVQGDALVWRDRPTDLRPPLEIEGPHDYLTEIHPQAEGFIRMLATRLAKGAVFLIDYGFPEREYYHPQRHMGTLMCHQAHQADGDPLQALGDKDITAHVNFTGLALAGQDAGLPVLGYTSQARFLMNCGILALQAQASLADRIHVQKLLLEHEMGELFKVLAFGVGEPWEPMGFVAGDRSHTL